MGKRAKTYLKLFVSIVIVCLLFFTIDIDTCLKTLSLISVRVFLLLVLIYIIGQVISALKWKIIANKLGFDKSFFSFIEYYFKGMFYNLFLPTNVGGDVMKIIYLRDSNNLSQSIERAFVSIVTDRLSGVFVLICLAFCGMFFLEDLNYVLKYLIIFGFLASLICISTVFFVKKFGCELKNVFLKKIEDYCSIFFDKSILTVLLLSLCFHILVIFIHVLIGKDLHLEINPFYYLILYPLAAIAASLPISLNGVGIKEAAYIYILNLIKISPSEAIVFVLCWNLVILLSGLFGAIFFYYSKEL